MTGIITGSVRTTGGALGELVIAAILGAGLGCLILLGIAVCGGLEHAVGVAR